MRKDSLTWAFTAFVDFAAACNDDLLAICSDDLPALGNGDTLLPSELRFVSTEDKVSRDDSLKVAPSLISP